MPAARLEVPAARLEARGLTAGYGPTTVVDRVDLSVASCERLVILGRNGVGKTTLLASLIGLATVRAGTVRLDDIDITALGASARARLGMGYVPQTRDIFPSLTVEENLRVGLKSRDRGAVDEAYAMFPRLAERRRNLGTQLSGGEQQMLSVARALLGRPTLLLLDEPLEGLAPAICDELMATITRMTSARTMTIVLVEQQVARAVAVADRILILERGRIAWEGGPTAFQAQTDIVDALLGVGVAAS